MNFDPQKFFIGIVDLFSVLLPGAAAAYLAWQWPFVRGLIGADIGSGPQAWLIFFFASYLIGHFLFLIGAKLDDRIYDPLTKATYLGQINRLRNGDDLAPRWLSKAAKWLLGDTDDKALMRAIRMKSLVLASPADAAAINTFQWSKARLSKEHPTGLAAVERLEADSKFFRSLVLPVALLVPILAVHCLLVETLIALALVPLVLWRYTSRRRKATHQAYWFVVALDNVSGASGKTLQRGTGEPTHAGGVVYKEHGGAIKYLVVEAEKNRKYLLVDTGDDRTVWVLPKGHIEPGEHPRETAVREVEEETGHWARIEAAIGNRRLGEGEDATLARFYLMKLASEDIEGNKEKEDKAQARLRRRDQRRPVWKLRDEAIALLTFGESQKLIADADALRAKIASEQKPR